MSDVTTIKGFSEKMKKYGVGKIRMLLDRGFYSQPNLDRLLDEGIGFYIPVPANIKWASDLINEHRGNVEMPEYMISVADDNKDAVYGMTVSSTIGRRRVWRHI